MTKRHLEALQRIGSIAAAAHRYEFRDYDGLFTEIRELVESASKAPPVPELTGPYAGCKRVFYHHAEAYYSKRLPKDDDRLDDVYFSIASEEGGTTGEFCIRWSMLGGKPTACLEVFDEAWGALALFPDVMAALAARTDRELPKRIDARGYWTGTFASITPEEVCAIARDCGVADVTKRIDPYAKPGAEPGAITGIVAIGDQVRTDGTILPSAELRKLHGQSGMVWEEHSKTLRYVGPLPPAAG